MSVNQLIISKHILSKGLILWTLTLEHFALTFPTVPTNSSSSPFSTFWHVLCFWPGYLVSFSSCFGTTGSALLTKSNSSFQTIAFPSLTQENKIRTLLWPQKSLSACGEMSTSKLTIWRPFPSSAWRGPAVTHSWALRWLVQLQALTALASHEPWTCLCYIHKSSVC